MTTQELMFSDILDKSLFEKANAYALNYAENAFERNVYPTDQSLEDLTMFDEPLPEKTGDAAEILDLLNRYGSPATISQIGGRYYGLVNGEWYRLLYW